MIGSWNRLLLPLAMLIGCGAADAPEQPRLPPRVTVAEVRIEEVRPVVETYGTLSHAARVEVFPAVEARITSISAEEGQHVRTGQLLAQLDTRRLEIARDQAQALITSRRAAKTLAREQLNDGRLAAEAQLILIGKAERELGQRRIEYQAIADLLARRRRLHAIGGVSTSELDAVQAQYERSRTEKRQAAGDLELRVIGYRDQDIRAAGLQVPESEALRTALLLDLNTRTLRAGLDVAAAELQTAEAELRRIEVSLEEALVRSPIDGVVAVRNLDVGGLARPQTTLFTILDTARLSVQTSVREAELASIAAGNRVTVQLGGRTQHTIGGTVQLITPYVDPGSRSAAVRVLLDDHDGTPLFPGMFARLEIATTTLQPTPVVPQSALTRDHTEQERVFVVRDGRLFSTPVAVLDTANGRVALSADLYAGDRVVLNAHQRFHDGMRVTITEE
ncbi:MAG: efflux RND transporter periplasmic adaptor subunit [Spirochaetaceae bacterium]|nr:MAG: efflux RND transporter periplasmic adaptor subunit [Spirochaetaceae bacterium]